MTKVSLEELVKSGAHFGHQIRRWNPKIKPFIYGEQEGIHIFDLVKTKAELEAALDVLTKASAAGKKIIIVGTKKQAREKVKEIAKESGINYVTERWLGGILTNFDQVKKSIKKLDEMRTKMAAGEYGKYTKKERLLIEREIARLERFFGGLEGLDALPDLIIIVDIKKEIGAVLEARFKGVETIGLVDSNADPDMVDWPIPINDDAKKVLDYVLGLFKEAILEGKRPKSDKKEATSDKKKVSIKKKLHGKTK